MRRSAHKDILDFLHRAITGSNMDQLSRRVCLMASLIQACVRNGHCRLERLSEATEAYRASKIQSAAAGQALAGQQVDGLADLLLALCPPIFARIGRQRRDGVCHGRQPDRFGQHGEVARFDTLRSTRSICFFQGALPLANAVYWKDK